MNYQILLRKKRGYRCTRLEKEISHTKIFSKKSPEISPIYLRATICYMLVSHEFLYENNMKKFVLQKGEKLNTNISILLPCIM